MAVDMLLFVLRPASAVAAAFLCLATAHLVNQAAATRHDAATEVRVMLAR